MIASLARTSPPPVGGSQQTKRTLRVVVVDDSVVMRQLISRMLTAEPRMEVVAFAKNGVEAIAKVEQFKPDLVTLDVEMPELDGTGALKVIKQKHPTTRVLMCSSLTVRGASVTIDALLLGADDYVAKQRSGEMNQSAFDSLRTELIAKVYALFPWLKGEEENAAAAPARVLRPVTPMPPIRAGLLSKSRPKVLAIGVSTGGPSALAELMPQFPADFPLPIVIVQHMPPSFTASLAERLNRISQISVREAAAGMTVRPGEALLAPGDYHLRLIRRGQDVMTILDQGERVNFCRPAVDVMFQSVADAYSGAAIVTVLTGMGQDGCSGAKLLRSLGATVLAQDKETSVVWGMPGAVVSANLADAVLPLTGIYPTIARLVE